MGKGAALANPQFPLNYSGPSLRAINYARYDLVSVFARGRDFSVPPPCISEPSASLDRLMSRSSVIPRLSSSARGPSLRRAAEKGETEPNDKPFSNPLRVNPGEHLGFSRLERDVLSTPVFLFFTELRDPFTTLNCRRRKSNQ